jgi:type II secretory pathway component GspD/PulD (secretin)
MKEFQFEGEWRRFLTEGDSQTLADQLENELGVKVQPASYDPDNNRVTIYPGSKPGDTIYSADPMAQTISVKYTNGLKLTAIKGYTKSLDLIGKPYNRTRYAGQGIWMESDMPVTINELKKYITQLQRGAEAESKAYHDFYKDWANPD